MSKTLRLNRDKPRKREKREISKMNQGIGTELKKKWLKTKWWL